MAANEDSAESIRTKKLTRKTVFFLGGWKARGLPKGGFGCGLAIKSRRELLYGTVMSSAKKEC